MGLFTKYCAVCGQKIEKGQDFVRFGKHFDSEDHADQYSKRLQEINSVPVDSGHQGQCCCG